MNSYMKNNKILTFLLFICLFNIDLCDVYSKSEHFRGAVSKIPSSGWEDGFVSGNGRMGAVLFGEPGNESIVINHCRLFLPLGSKEIVPDVSSYVSQLRDTFLVKGSKQALSFLFSKAKEKGFGGLINTDPYHPGFFIGIKYPHISVLDSNSGDLSFSDNVSQSDNISEKRNISDRSGKLSSVSQVRDYIRTENFRTGEVCVRWCDNNGEYIKRMFVSRADNAVVLHLKSPVPVQLDFLPVEHSLISSIMSEDSEWITYHNIYTKGKGGYDAVVRKTVKDNGKDVLLVMRIVPWKTPLPESISEAWAYSVNNPDFAESGKYLPNPSLSESSVVSYLKTEDSRNLLSMIKDSMQSLHTDYDRLMEPHMKIHSELFDRVSFTLSGNDTAGSCKDSVFSSIIPDSLSRNLSDSLSKNISDSSYIANANFGMIPSEELISYASQNNVLPDILVEKMYDAGRYMLISCCGELPPNLQGIWTGTWKPAWSGDFTLDTNVQSAMASACSANLTDLMNGYFNLIESFYPDWRTNARKIYGCRGVYTNARASNTALMLHWGEWGGVFWTAGCGWLANFFTQYAKYTGDDIFLKERCIPLLKEVADFYEDFLTVRDDNGKVIFVPSYNPETDWDSQVNSTMDIAVARDVLCSLISSCSRLNIESDNIVKWKSLLASLPEYPVNNGEITEYPTGSTAAGHRHHSQLYPCFQSFESCFRDNEILKEAAQNTVATKIKGSDNGGEQSTFGRIQAGISAAFLNLPELAMNRLKVIATKKSMYNSLMTSHEPEMGIFNVDGNGGVPQIINTMLMQSNSDGIILLPSLPEKWKNGKIAGILAQGGFKLDIEWKDGILYKSTVHSTLGGKCVISYKKSSFMIDTEPGESVDLIFADGCFSVIARYCP